MTDRFIVFDLEMPGQRELRISAIGITVVENGKITDNYYHLVNPETEFDPYVIDLVGITPQMVENEPTFPEIWNHIEDIMSSGILVAHGAPGDLRTLCTCLNYYGIMWEDKIKYICTCDLAQAFYPYAEHYSLDFLCDHIGYTLDHHNALSDSEGCARLLIEFLKNGAEAEKFISVFNALKCQKIRKNNSKRKKSLPEKVQSVLFSMRDEKAKASFLRKYPETDESRVIGVKEHRIRDYAAWLCKNNKSHEFIRNLRHDYHEENNLHAVLISKQRKFSLCIKHIDDFLPYIDNYETAELIDPFIFKSRQNELPDIICRWFCNENKYAKVIAINMMKRYFLTEEYLGKWFDMILNLKSDNSYINKKRAEFFAAALIKYEERILPFIVSDSIDKWTHNMTLQIASNSKGVKIDKKEMYVSLRR